jgi:hypothetical protein
MMICIRDYLIIYHALCILSAATSQAGSGQSGNNNNPGAEIEDDTGGDDYHNHFGL